MIESIPDPKIQEKIDKAKEIAGYERVALTALGFITIGAVFYHIVEKLSWLNAFYFTTITLATVGYGDIVPKTDAGKIFTMFYVLIGISIFVALARIVLARIVVRGDQRRQKKELRDLHLHDHH